MLFKKVRNRRDISYIFVKNPKLDRFYLVPKIHKRLYNLPGGPVILNLGYFTGNIYFLLISTKTSAQKVKSYIQDTNDFEKYSKSSSFARWPYFMHNRWGRSLSEYSRVEDLTTIGKALYTKRLKQFQQIL